MIFLEFKSIILNIFFGIMFTFFIDLASVFLHKNKSIILENLIYFLITILIGFVYIFYLDNSIFVFRFYHILFICLGVYLSNKFSYLNIRNNSTFFKILLSKSRQIMINFLLFSINFKLWFLIYKKFSKNKR